MPPSGNALFEVVRVGAAQGEVGFGQLRVYRGSFWGGPQLDQVVLAAVADARLVVIDVAVQAHPDPRRYTVEEA